MKPFLRKPIAQIKSDFRFQVESVSKSHPNDIERRELLPKLDSQDIVGLFGEAPADFKTTLRVSGIFEMGYKEYGLMVLESKWELRTLLNTTSELVS